jgi:hypothetical protein
MSALDISSDVKPFCPAHHWRMATDCLGPDGTYVYRCNYDQCLVRYHAEEGYFESGRIAGHRAFLANVEAVACPRSHDHQPRIVSYGKDSTADQTEEWRHWQCHSHGCNFTYRQRLTSTAIPLKRKEQVTPDRALAVRGTYTLATR